MSNPGALQVGLLLAQALEARSVPYALGGALAYGIWAAPRNTMDVDLNMFTTGEHLPPAIETLAASGVALNPGEAAAAAADGGQFIGWYGEVRIDVFTPSIDFSWEALRTRVRSDVYGAPAWFLSAEALSVFKLLFFRSKDIADLERLLGTRGKLLDAPYVRRWMAEMMGDDDPRVRKWDELVTQFWR